MDLHNDNALRAIDKRFLGPDGFTLWWEARWMSYMVWAGVLVVLVLFEIRFNLVGGSVVAIANTVVIDMAISVGATTLIMQHVDAERPVMSVFRTFWNELGTPRAPRAVTVDIHVPHIARKAAP